MFISHRICVLTWSVVRARRCDYASTNERNYLMINHNTAGMCEQMHRRGLEMDEGSKGPTAMEVMAHRAQCPQDQLLQHSEVLDPEQDLGEDAGLQASTSSGRKAQPHGGHFHSHGILSEDCTLLETDGIHLKKWSKDTFASSLAKLVRRHLDKE